MASIHIPKNMTELIELTEKIIHKHKCCGDESPLRNIDLQLMFMNMEELRNKHDEYMRMKKECDELRDEIQLKLGVHRSQNKIPPQTIRFYVLQVRDVLKGIKRNSINELKEWGYTISENDLNPNENE